MCFLLFPCPATCMADYSQRIGRRVGTHQCLRAPNWGHGHIDWHVMNWADAFRYSRSQQKRSRAWRLLVIRRMDTVWCEIMSLTLVYAISGAFQARGHNVCKWCLLCWTDPCYSFVVIGSDTPDKAIGKTWCFAASACVQPMWSGWQCHV